MAAQAFFYNAIFFTYALILIAFYGIASDRVGLYLLPFAIGNFLGPLLIGRLFDTHGRRIMIAFTYIVSGILLALTGCLFMKNLLDAVTQTVCWTIIFFFASCAASSAYLTVRETFPLEIRALAIAFLYAVGTGICGTLAARYPGPGNCFLLCRRHWNWRHPRPITIWAAHRHRFACQRVLGLSV